MATLKEKLASRNRAARDTEKPSPIKIRKSDPTTASAKRPKRPEPREMGRTEGEDIPFGNPQTEEPAASWHEAVTALDTDLGIWIDGDHAWLAVESRNGDPHLILIHQLPLLSNRNENEPY